MTSVAACQLPLTPDDVVPNVDRLRDRILALPDRVTLAVAPEYALTGGPEDGVAIDPQDERLDPLASAAEAAGCVVLAGMLEDADEGPYNAALLFDGDDRRVGYRKRLLWDDEDERVAPGDTPGVIETPLGRTGVLICHDLNDVRASAELAAARVDAIAVLGAWPAAHARNWDLLVRARALDGVRWVVAANRPGPEHAGRSVVVRPDGQVAAGIGVEADDCVADCDPAVLAHHRELIDPFGE
jgi:predicted amidohydrolase